MCSEHLDGGGISREPRDWFGLQEHLAPLHSFGIADHASVGLTHLDWKCGGYMQADIDKVFGAIEVREKSVLNLKLTPPAQGGAPVRCAAKSP